MNRFLLAFLFALNFSFPVVKHFLKTKKLKETLMDLGDIKTDLRINEPFLPSQMKPSSLGLLNFFLFISSNFSICLFLRNKGFEI